MFNLRQTQERILAAVPVLGRENVSLLEALNRVLVEDIVAVEDLPDADIAAVDGYAVARRFLLEGDLPEALAIIGEAPAGQSFVGKVAAGEAVRIMTGGLLPVGADTIIRAEDAAEVDGKVVCRQLPALGDGIRRQGENLRRGDRQLMAGDLVGPSEIGVLAGLRRAYVLVHRRPTVAVLATGSELCDFHEPQVPGRPVCASKFALAAQVIAAGGVPLALGIAQDDFEQQRRFLSEARQTDVIVIAGGSSRSKYDLTREVLDSLGWELIFTSEFVKPRKPTIVGSLGECVVFGLPGNLPAAMLSFDQFIKPVLFKMAGRRDPFAPASCQGNAAASGAELTNLDSFNPENTGSKERPAQLPLRKNKAGK